MTTPTAPTMRLYRSRRASHHLIYSRLLYGAAVVVSDDMQQVCDQRRGPVHPRTVALWSAFRTSDAWLNCCQQVKSLIEFEHAQENTYRASDMLPAMRIPSRESRHCEPQFTSGPQWGTQPAHRVLGCIRFYRSLRKVPLIFATQCYPLLLKRHDSNLFRPLSNAIHVAPQLPEPSLFRQLQP